MEQIIIAIAFFLIYYNISGLATTNILRLTAPNTLTILSSKCVCDNCATRITALYQLPIISFVVCRGRCRKCGCKIPTDALLLEIIVLIGMFGISALLSFSLFGVTMSFVFYEICRVAMILIKSKRKTGFVRQYFIALIAMIPFYTITMFVALINSTL